MQINKTQLSELLHLQQKVSVRLTGHKPGEGESKCDYPLATMMECVEALDHTPWKWWKKHEALNMEQIQLEAIDIFIFTLSEILARNQNNVEQSVQYILTSNNPVRPIYFDDNEYHLQQMSLQDKLKLLTGISASGRHDISLVLSVCADCGLSWDDLYCIFVEKNVLNVFRQDNGYKDGSYIKIWNNMEDNEHLSEIVSCLRGVDQYSDLIYNQLQLRYKAYVS